MDYRITSRSSQTLIAGVLESRIKAGLKETHYIVTKLESVKSAVEWLKGFFNSGLKVQEEYILEKIDQAFPDLKDEGER